MSSPQDWPVEFGRRIGQRRKSLQANAEAIASVAHALEQQGGARAAALKVAEQYVAAFGQIARQGTTVVIPSNLADLAGLVQGALSVLPKKSADSSQS